MKLGGPAFMKSGGSARVKSSGPADLKPGGSGGVKFCTCMTYANRYAPEITLIRDAYKTFVEHADLRFKQMEQYKGCWEAIDLELKRLHNATASYPHANEGLEALTSEKVYLETVKNVLEQARPFIGVLPANMRNFLTATV